MRRQLGAHARRAPSIAHGSEPSPPAFDTAMASALPCTPAIGAWMIGSSMPSRWRTLEATLPMSDDECQRVT